MITGDGDQRLRAAGIDVPCAKPFGLLGRLRYLCERPYGHTGSHKSEDGIMDGARDAEDEIRTRFTIAQILKGRTP